MSVDKAFLDDLSKSQAVFLLVDGLHVPFFIESFEPDEENSLIKLEEINAPETAKSWNGEQIFLNVRDVSPESLKNQNNSGINYIVGFTLVDNSTKNSFVIKALEEYPQQLMAIVDVDGREALIPLVEEWISSIDEQHMQIFMDLPDGLI